MIEETLKKLGLNDKEISIYLASLTIGSSPASVLGIRTGISRSTAQYVCQQLAKKGIIRSIQKNNAFIYSPESPDKILYLLDQQKKELAEKEDQAYRIVGDLKAMMNPLAVLPKVRFFEGLDGLIEMFNDVLIENKPLFGIGKIDDSIDDRILQYIQNIYVPKRKQLKNPAWMLFNENFATIEYQKLDLEMNRTSMLLPQKNFPFETCCHIYGQKVAFYSYRKNDLTGVIIENTYISQSQFSLFKASWQFAQKQVINKKYLHKNLPESLI